ncbi:MULTISPECIES: tyrosinase family protein [Protofrankia]|uniref:Monophenol monooxygenase n=1 Tax=Candidatus Protofrankia datiscae TaxID=2716812 RepID=F8B1J1_9ACTN|nr:MULTISPECIES: tyrosinase family protein [Protofrankia]AEH10743.1 Monophenol monooxygenase [Candidatus Protofrankia datiscae]
MAVVRRNILRDAASRDLYVQGVRLLKAEFLGPTTADLGIGGQQQQVSTYDLFVAWHHIAMSTFTPPSQGDRNAAHRGPVFLPWHRFMLVLLELQLQRVLGNENFGLPYWDWSSDGDLPAAEQPDLPLWAGGALGGQGDPVATGPFAFDPSDPGSWRVLIDTDVQGRLRGTNRGLRRQFAANASNLPTNSDIDAALDLGAYDQSPWSTTSNGFRNRLEGWRPLNTAPGLHNRVHVWVGGDMLPSSSPNDPVFYLNHCNVDRIWASWQEIHPESPYVPTGTASTALTGHRIDDAMFSLLSAPATPRQMLDVSDIYKYDALFVTAEPAGVGSGGTGVVRMA